jgi:hypothetical protein
MTTDKKHTIIFHKNMEGVCQINFYLNGIVEISWDTKLKEINKEHLIQIKKNIGEIGGGKKMPVYISTIDFLAISDSGKKYSASDEGQAFTLANAVLIDNLAKKILFNFYMNINKPKTLTKAFGTKVDAFAWLLSL